MSAAAAPGGLFAAADAALARARAAGALRPIASEAIALEEAGIRFAVRRLAAAAAPPPPGRAATPDPPPSAGSSADPGPAPVVGPGANPFADPDPDLVVGPIGDTHLCLLNKFPVLDRHLLLVTRAFAPQEAWLDLADWTALAAALLAAGEALAFYNGGERAGASQPHKHLQLVPIAAVGVDAALPIAPWLAAAPPGDGPIALPGASFPHAFVRFAPGAWREPARVAAAADAALAAVGVRAVATPGGLRQSGPYNLLATRDWLLAVPRARAEAEGLPVNALGFAGAFVVRDAAGLARLRAVGPLAVLRAVTGSDA